MQTRISQAKPSSTLSNARNSTVGVIDASARRELTLRAWSNAHFKRGAFANP